MRNAGGGPALSARVLWPSPNGWIVSKPVDVAAYGSAHPTLTAPFEGSEDDARELLHSMRTDDVRSAYGAIVCRDFLDRRWCFPLRSDWDGEKVLAINAEVLTPMFWRPAKRVRRAPAWAISKTLWPEGYALFIGQTA